MGFVRLSTALTRDKALGRYVVPIVPDESRTFGMEGMFRQLGIYAPEGQLYIPEDADQLMYYREDIKGQVLQEGITESGAMSSWIAAATSYSNHGIAMMPFYIFYSMFGLQRVGDLAWAAGDQQARGFPDRRYRWPNHFGRRRSAASGWSQSAHGIQHSQLRGLRSGIQLRACRHRA